MMRKQHFSVLSSLLAGVVFSAAISGCTVASLRDLRQDVKRNDDLAREQLASQASSAVEAQRNRSNIQMVEGAYVGVRRADEIATEAFVKAAGAQHIAANKQFAHIGEVAGYITEKLGVGVSIAPDVWVAPGAASTMQNMIASPQTSSASAPIPGVPLTRAAATGALASTYPGVAQGVNQTAGVALGGSVTQPVWLKYEGALSGFADAAGSRFSVSWEWAKNSNGSYGIRFFRYTTRVYRLFALPGDTKLDSSISNSLGSTGSSGSGGGATGGGGGGTSGSGTSSQQSGVSFSSLSVWSAAGDSIRAMMSPGRSPVVNAATGDITVTDTPEVLEMVGRHIEALNTSLSRQVVVNVRVLSVDLTDNNQRGINWNAIYQSLSGNFGLSFATAFSAPTDATNLTLKILDTAGTVTNSSIQSWQGSSAIIHALETQGRVTQMTSATLTTLNNQVAPMQNGSQTSYLASSTTNTVANSGSTTTLQPGVINTGFSMSVVPHILDANKLMLQYSINLSSLLSLKSVTSNGSTIQTPNIDARNFLQRVMMSSGETLVMSGFEQATSSASTQGVVDAQFPGLGGAIEGARSRSVLVILLQPVVVGG